MQNFNSNFIEISSNKHEIVLRDNFLDLSLNMGILSKNHYEDFFINEKG